MSQSKLDTTLPAVLSQLPINALPSGAVFPTATSSWDSVATSSRETLPPPAKQELASASACWRPANDRAEAEERHAPIVRAGSERTGERHGRRTLGPSDLRDRSHAVVSTSSGSAFRLFCSAKERRQRSVGADSRWSSTVRASGIRRWLAEVVGERRRRRPGVAIEKAALPARAISFRCAARGAAPPLQPREACGPRSAGELPRDL